MAAKLLTDNNPQFFLTSFLMRNLLRTSIRPIYSAPIFNLLPRFIHISFKFRVWCSRYTKSGKHQGEIMEHVVFAGAEVMVGDPQFLQRKMSAVRFYGPAKLQDPWPTRAKWEKTHSLLIEGGLDYDAIRSSVANSKIASRDGVIELFELLEKSNVPVLVFSAGLADIIEEVLRQKLHTTFDNVKIVSNRMVFNQSGNLVSFKGKTIHVLNKNEHAINMAGPVRGQLVDSNGMTNDASYVKLRTKVLLLGDHIGDLGMSDGLNYNTRISVGFLNDNIENSRDTYRKSFDVVYMNDASVWEVVKIASQLCSPVSD